MLPMQFGYCRGLIVSLVPNTTSAVNQRLYGVYYILPGDSVQVWNRPSSDFVRIHWNRRQPETIKPVK